MIYRNIAMRLQPKGKMILRDQGQLVVPWSIINVVYWLEDNVSYLNIIKDYFLEIK